MKKHNVLIIIPNLGKGGAQQIFRDQFRFYAQHGRVYGCVFNWEGAFQDDHQKDIISLDVPAGKNMVSKIYYFIRRVSKLRKLKVENKIDISISHLEGADYVNILSRHKEKIILWIHGTKKFDDEIGGGLGWVRKKIFIPFLYKKSDRIITVSEGIRKELIEDFDQPSNKIKTIFNGIAIDKIQTAAAESDPLMIGDILKGQVILITHCRLARQKNLEALLRIFAIVNPTRKIKLVILGDGELREQLIHFANALSLNVYSVWQDSKPDMGHDVFFMGYQRNPYRELAKATLYLMTSSWEGFPLSLCEAIACRIPVMAADCPTGPREILAPELQTEGPVKQPYFSATGILMPLANSEEDFRVWAETIKRVLEDESLRSGMIAAGNNRIRDFDNAKIVGHWVELIQL